MNKWFTPALLIGKRKLLNWIGGNSSKLYSARLFRTEKSAIFCMCLYQPLHMQLCEKVIASKYTGIQGLMEYNGVTLSSNEVAIRASENNEWKVTFQRTKILRTEIEIQEVYQNNFEELLELNYPPRIDIGVTLTPVTPNPKPLELLVEGLNEDCTFNLLPDYYVIGPHPILPQDLPHSSITTQGLSRTDDVPSPDSDAPRPKLRKLSPAADSADVREFSEDLSSGDLYGYLLLKHVPKRDCDIIKEREISGVSFLELSIKYWETCGISEPGVIAIVKLQEKIKAAQATIIPNLSPHVPVNEDAAEVGEKERKKEGGVELSEMDRKAIFDEAMNLGYIDVNIIKILVVGAGGVGKSCLLKFLCDLPAPDKYNSTGCIDRAQRVTCERILTNKDDSSEEIVWKLVGSEELKHFLVNAIKSRAATLTPKNEEIQLDVKSSQSSVPKSTEEETSLGEVTEEVVQLIGSTEEETSLGEFIKVVQLVGHKGGKLFSITWIYLVDSGGQPQFHELLTAFVRNATLGIFVVNLSEQLDDKPEIKYYKDGKPCGDKSYRFPLSHKEIFQHCVQTISSLYPIDHSLPSTAFIETKERIAASKPEILVVGTHREEEGKSEESREEKEEKLNKILQPYTGIIKNDGKYIIFPIDSISRSESDKDVLNKIRRGIVKDVKPFCKTQLPLQYYALELELEVLAKKKGCDVISFEKCFNKFGPSLSFDKRKFLAAIQHLDELNLIMYFESHAPDVIFTNPNTLLDKVSEIVEKSYIWSNKVDSIEVKFVSGKSTELIKLIKRGEATLEVLKSFESSYVEGLFDHITLAKILTHLFVLVPISEDTYFMPSLLEVYEDLNSPTNDFFAVSFPSNAPMGLFSSSVVCLLSNKRWKIVSTPDRLFRNSLTFNVGLASVTLLDKRSHFEVHIKLNDFKKKLSESRFNIREDLINAIDEVKKVRKFWNLDYSECFRCPHSGTSPHLAKFEYSEEAGDFILKCTKDCSPSISPAEEWHKQLFGILSPSLEDVTTEKEVEPHTGFARVTTSSSVSTVGESTAHSIDHASLKYLPTESNTTPSASTDSNLTTLNIKKILKDEDFSAGIAEELGLFLGIKQGRIDTLRKNNNGNADQLLTAIIEEWLRNDKEKSWKKLADAVRSCHHPLLADKILEQYCGEERKLFQKQQQQESSIQTAPVEKMGLTGELNIIYKRTVISSGSDREDVLLGKDFTAEKNKGLSKPSHDSDAPRPKHPKLSPAPDSAGLSRTRDAPFPDSDAPRSKLPKLSPSADVREFNEDLSSEDLYRYLLLKHVPKRDCDIIKEEGIPGLSFLDLSKEDWKDYGLSRAGVIAVVKIQERIKAAQIEPSTSPHISDTLS